ncbi:hypothetical protein EVAR_42762_1 [Eumeta japonica]|uniref:Uncharacterized protein n=1 Tax=Eumeta variegata TaxID=151549 RepID=A0A4C1WK00_EUMVA|nr:hypothetical protein EVAR_42762_1 [Eumeta japonica]
MVIVGLMRDGRRRSTKIIFFISKHDQLTKCNRFNASASACHKYTTGDHSTAVARDRRKHREGRNEPPSAPPPPAPVLGRRRRKALYRRSVSQAGGGRCLFIGLPLIGQ